MIKCTIKIGDNMVFLSNLFNKEKEEKVVEFPTIEEIKKDAEDIKSDPEIQEAEIPEALSAYYYAIKDIEVDPVYIKDVLNGTNNYADVLKTRMNDEQNENNNINNN